MKCKKVSAEEIAYTRQARESGAAGRMGETRGVTRDVKKRSAEPDAVQSQPEEQEEPADQPSNAAEQDHPDDAENGHNELQQDRAAESVCPETDHGEKR